MATFTCECNEKYMYKTEQSYYKHFNSKKHKEWEENDRKNRFNNLIDKYVPHLQHKKK